MGADMLVPDTKEKLATFRQLQRMYTCYIEPGWIILTEKQKKRSVHSVKIRKPITVILTEISVIL